MGRQCSTDVSELDALIKILIEEKSIIFTSAGSPKKHVSFSRQWNKGSARRIQFKFAKKCGEAGVDAVVAPKALRPRAQWSRREHHDDADSRKSDRPITATGLPPVASHPEGRADGPDTWGGGCTDRYTVYDERAGSSEQIQTIALPSLEEG